MYECVRLSESSSVEQWRNFVKRTRCFVILQRCQVCFEDCATEDASYFALFAGRICVCGDDASFLEQVKESGTCETPCSGDETLFCGGDDEEYDLYGERLLLLLFYLPSDNFLLTGGSACPLPPCLAR